MKSNYIQVQGEEDEQEKSDLIRKIKRLEFKVHQIVESTLSGSHHSLFRGQGIEFDEFREYAFGDEIKNIDWNVTARVNKPYIKCYQEERELIFNLIIDHSGSNQFSSREPTKRDMINEITAALTFSILKNKDKVGCLTFSNQVEKYLRPRKGIQHGFKIISECLFYKTESKATNLGEVLKFFAKIQSKRSIVFILSDFLFALDSRTPNSYEDFSKWLQFLAFKHNVYIVQTLDPLELEMKKIGLVEFQDSETGETVLMDTSSKKVRTHYNKSIQEHQARLKKIFQKNKVRHLVLTSDQDYFSKLATFLRHKK